MTLSKLQKYILRQGLEGRVSKNILEKFYLKEPRPPKDKLDVITKSAERLIKRGLIKGVGIKTAERWFIRELILTPSGIKQAKLLLGRQIKLPFKK
ncbi:MAG: hypothetical protein AAB791_01310 [Patescibacteria group bacterium]